MTTESLTLAPAKLFVLSVAVLCALLNLAAGYVTYLRRWKAEEDRAERPDPPAVNQYDGGVSSREADRPTRA